MNFTTSEINIKNRGIDENSTTRIDRRQMPAALFIPESDVFTLAFTSSGKLPRLDPSVRNQQIDRFAGMGFSFVQLAHGGKTPFVTGWQHNPLAADQAQRTKGNVGALLGKYSNNIICIDLDERAHEFFAMFPHLRETLIVWRDNATDRAKLFVQVDRLPRSTNWKRTPTAKPSAELLATGRQAVIVGVHETGAVIKNNGRQPLTLTFADLSAIWRRWTGLELPDPTRTSETTTTTKQRRQRAIDAGTNDANPLANEIKQHWDCMAVFAHFGRAGDVVANRGETRLRGNGGLLVDTERDIWYCHTDQVGGDCIAAWAYCEGHRGPLTGAGFMATINAMRAAVGLAPVERKSSGVDWPALLAHYSQPEAFERGRQNAANRSVMTALLTVMQSVDNPVIKMSVRELGERAGMAFKTAWKTLGRLIDTGLIAADYSGPSWLDRDVVDENDEKLRNQFEARTLSLSHAAAGADPSFGIDYRQNATGAGVPSVVNSERCVTTDLTLDTHTATEYLDSDFFQWGAKIFDTDCRFGRAALDVIAALEMSNDQSYTDLAESTGRSKSTVSAKCNALALIGVVELYREGRSLVAYLVDNWRDVLERMIAALTTLGRTIKRKISHLEARIGRAGCALNLAESGWLRMRLAQMIERWRAKLLALAEQLRSLLALRSAVFANA